MSVYLADSNGYLTDFASLGGLEKFTAWVETLPSNSEISKFFERGFTLEPSTLASVHFEAPNDVLAEMFDNLVRQAAKANGVLILSDGTSVGSEPRNMEEKRPTLRTNLGAATKDYAHIHAAADGALANFTAAVLHGFNVGIRALPNAALAQALKAGDERRTLELIDPALTAMELALQRSLPTLLVWIANEAGRSTFGKIPQERAAVDPKPKLPKQLPVKKPPVAIKFFEKDPLVTEWAEAHAGELISGVATATRGYIRELLTSAFSGHARDVGELARGIETAIGDRARAETIARTETIKAANEGQLAAWDQAEKKGLLNGNELKTWIAVDTACPICEDLDGQEVPVNDEFESAVSGDSYDSPPAHPNCRCAMGMSLP